MSHCRWPWIKTTLSHPPCRRSWFVDVLTAFRATALRLWTGRGLCLWDTGIIVLAKGTGFHSRSLPSLIEALVLLQKTLAGKDTPVTYRSRIKRKNASHDTRRMWCCNRVEQRSCFLVFIRSLNLCSFGDAVNPRANGFASHSEPCLAGVSLQCAARSVTEKVSEPHPWNSFSEAAKDCDSHFEWAASFGSVFKAAPPKATKLNSGNGGVGGQDGSWRRRAAEVLCGSIQSPRGNKFGGRCSVSSLQYLFPDRSCKPCRSWRAEKVSGACCLTWPDVKTETIKTCQDLSRHVASQSVLHFAPLRFGEMLRAAMTSAAESGHLPGHRSSGFVGPGFFFFFSEGAGGLIWFEDELKWFWWLQFLPLKRCFCGHEYSSHARNSGDGDPGTAVWDSLCKSSANRAIHTLSIFVILYPSLSIFVWFMRIRLKKLQGFGYPGRSPILETSSKMDSHNSSGNVWPIEFVCFNALKAFPTRLLKRG